MIHRLTAKGLPPTQVAYSTLTAFEESLPRGALPGRQVAAMDANDQGAESPDTKSGKARSRRAQFGGQNLSTIFLARLAWL
jgi:hypothetical protein